MCVLHVLKERLQSGDIYLVSIRKPLIFLISHTDVNIAIKMIDDCLLGNVDTIALVSTDGDLLTPLSLINERFPNVKIRVYFPPANKSDALNNFMKSHKKRAVELGNSKGRFQYSVLPDAVTKDNTTYTIPTEWKTKQP